MTEQELRDAIAYHRKVHRPFLFAPAPGPMSECGLPTCQAVMAELERARHEHGQADAVLAALEGDGSPAGAIVHHMAHCTDATTSSGSWSPPGGR